MKIKDLVCFCCVYLMLSTGATAVEIPSGYIRVEILNIGYLGDGRYKIEITLMNKSDREITVADVRKKFYAQSEVLGQWIALDTEKAGIATGSTGIKPFGEQSSVSVIHLPLNTPKLYLNGFGDLNLKFLHELKFRVKNRSTVLTQADESSYWVTPGTDKWILREGM